MKTFGTCSYFMTARVVGQLLTTGPEHQRTCNEQGNTPQEEGRFYVAPRHAVHISLFWLAFESICPGSINRIEENVLLKITTTHRLPRTLGVWVRKYSHPRGGIIIR